MNTRTGLASSAVALLSGCLILQGLSVLPDVFWLSWLPLILFLFFISPLARMASLLVVGFLWALLHAHLYFTHVLPESLAGDDIWVTGHVVDLPQWQGRALRFDFKLDAGDLPSRYLRLGWYKNDRYTGPWPGAGERWRLKVKLKPPHGSSNPGGFDYEMWLYQRGVHATGYVRDDEDNHRLAWAPWWSVDALRQRVAEAIASDNRPFAGMLTALAVGNASDIDNQQWDDLLVTGTNHLISISGLHISMVAGLVYWLVLRLIPARVLRRYPAQPLAASAALLAAILYAALAGFAVPTQRSLVMLAVVLGAVVLRRPLQPLHALATAMIAVLILDPLAVLSPGFWFSFMAVAVIAYGYAGRLGRGNVWWRFGRIHWLITLALFPLSLFLFQQTSIVSPLANLFLVPWVSLVVVPVVLLGAVLTTVWPALAQGLFDLADICMQISWPAVHWLAQLPLAKWVQPAPSFVAMLLALCGVLLLLAPRGFPQRWLGGVMLLPALLVSPSVPAPGVFRATLLDVGQGLSVVVQTHQHVLVFDTGPRFGEDTDAGERMLLPYLQHLGIATIDKLVISNGDADHIGGAASLLKNIHVVEVTGKDIDGLQHQNKTPCATGQSWHWDGVEFYVLHPAVNQIESQRNNHSCVLKVSNGNESLLIAADIEKKIEKRLLASQLDRLRSDVLVVPHHGSNTSSTEAFIAAVQPRYALVSAGYRNRFGHPRPEVVERYLDAGSVMINTAQAGAIELMFDTAPGLEPVLHRQLSRHYWNAPVK
jgi:competence protein ComEC